MIQVKIQILQLIIYIVEESMNCNTHTEDPIFYDEIR
jgi:hypothetical protein